MTDREFPGDFPAITSPALVDPVFASQGGVGGGMALEDIARLFALEGELFEKAQRGGLDKQTEITFHGVFDYTANFLINRSAWYTALPLMTGETKVMWIYAPAGIPLVPAGYPSSLQSINGNPVGDIVPFGNFGLYVVFGDGANAWEVEFVNAMPKTDFTGSSGIPTSSFDSTAGWGVGSMILTSTDKLYIAKSVAPSSAVWIDVTGSGTAFDPYLKRWNRSDLTQFDAEVNYSVTNFAANAVYRGGAPGNSAIELTADAASAGGIVTKMFTGLIPFEDCTLHVSFVPGVADPADDWYVGVLFACTDQANCMMLGVRLGVSTDMELRIRAGGTGSTIHKSATSANVTRGIRASIAGVIGPSGEPDFHMDLSMRDSSGNGDTFFVTTDEIFWDPAWSGNVGDRLGVFLYSPAGAVNPVTARIARIELERGAH